MSVMKRNMTALRSFTHIPFHVLRKGCAFFVMLLVLASPLSAQLNTENIVLMGRNALYFDDYVTAMRLFTQAIEARPRNARPYYFRAYAKFTLEDYVGAEADCSQAIFLNPYLTEFYQLRGLCRIHNKNYEGAVEDYSRALTDMPNDQASLYNRALCRLELKDYTNAEADLDHLLRRWPKLSKVYLVKAQMALERQDTARSLTLIDTLLTLNPREASAWSFKGRHALDKGNYALADSCLTQAIGLQPSNYEHYLLRAMARNGRERIGAALQDYDKVIQLIPQHFVAHYNRGLLRAEAGDDNRAIEDFDFVISLEPDNILAIYNRALLREQTGDYRGAVADYTAILHEYPDFTYGYAARARCRRKIGDTRGALQDETRVQRAELDLAFGTNSRRPTRKVRRRSDRSLENYQQLVEEDADTTRVYTGELFGKVQNKPVEKDILPPFILTIGQQPDETKKATEGYLPEMAAVQATPSAAGRLRYSPSHAEIPSGGVTAYAPMLDTLATHIRRQPDSRSHLLRSALYATLYNDDAALRDATAATQADSTSYLALSQQTALLLRVHQSADTAATSPHTDRTSRLMQARLAADRAVRLWPANAYAHYNRGCIRFHQHDYSGAIEDFTRALTLDSRLAEAYYNRAVVYLITGEADKAAPDLSRAGEAGLYKAYSLLKKSRQQ